MSISSELLTLNNTKQSIKASINAKGGSITENTPFADYSTAIDNLPSGGSSDLILKSNSEVSDYSGTTISNWSSFYKAVGFEVKLPPTVTSYGRLFSGTGFTKIIFPSSYSFTTNQGLFYNCQNLKEIDLSNSGLTDLNFYKAYSSDTSKGFFQECSSLTSVTLPSTITSIGENAFYNCSALTSIDIPSGVTSIGANAFNNCSSLTSINLPNSLTTIGNSAFKGTGITSLTIPSSVSTISTTTGFSLLFSSNNANADFHITVDANNVTYDSRGNCNAIIETSTNKLIQGCNNTVIPNTVTALGGEAFRNVNFYGKTFFEVPDSVTNYGGDFSYVSNSNLHFKIGKGISTMPNILFNSTIDTLEVPETITTWNGFSVLNNGSVKKYILHNPTPVTITQNPTYFVRPSEAIYVPAESVEAYKADSFWSNYASIIQAIPTE